MKFAIAIVILCVLSSCASISEYNQGCRDGVNGIGLENGSKEKIDRYCSDLDSLHKLTQERKN